MKKTLISGPILTLRPYTPADLPYVTSLWLDPENGKYLSDPTAPYVDTVYRSALDHMADTPLGAYYVITLTSTSQPIGTCCAFPSDDGAAYDIGYCIQRSHWRQGYATQALTLLESHLFAQGAQFITAEVALENTASASLLQKLGYTPSRESQFQKYNMPITYKSQIFTKSAPTK